MAVQAFAEALFPLGTEIHFVSIIGDSVPTLSVLNQYDAVLCWTNGSPVYPDSLGDRLAEYAAFSASRDLVLALKPAWDLDEVTRRVRATTEARRLLDLKPNLSIGGARDVRPAVELARRGGTLAPEAYLEIMATLASARSLKASVLRQRETCPTLADTAEWMEERPSTTGSWPSRRTFSAFPSGAPEWSRPPPWGLQAWRVLPRGFGEVGMISSGPWGILRFSPRT